MRPERYAKMMTPKPWFKVAKNSAEKAELYIYDDIGQDCWGQGIRALDLIEAFNALTAPVVDVRFNSFGGMITEGKAIYNAFARSGKTINGYVDAMAASITSVILMACDKIYIAKNATIMIHNPWLGTMGDATALRKAADYLDMEKRAFVEIYSERTKAAAKDVARMMDDQTFFDAALAVEWGFADEIAFDAPPEMKAAAAADDADRQSWKLAQARAALARPETQALSELIEFLEVK